MKIEPGQQIWLYKNDYGYFIRIAKKKKKDSSNYLYAFIPVKLSNKIGDIPSKTKIEIIDSWLSFNFNENTGRAYPYIFINDIKVLDSLDTI